MARGHTPPVEILQRAVEILQWVARGVAVLWHTRRVGMAHGRRRWHLYCQLPGIGGVRLAAGRPCEGHGARSLRRQGEGMAPGRLGGWASARTREAEEWDLVSRTRLRARGRTLQRS